MKLPQKPEPTIREEHSLDINDLSDRISLSDALERCRNAKIKNSISDLSELDIDDIFIDWRYCYSSSSIQLCFEIEVENPSYKKDLQKYKDSLQEQKENIIREKEKQIQKLQEEIDNIKDKL